MKRKSLGPVESPFWPIDPPAKSKAPTYQLYEDSAGSLFIISSGNPEEADCLTPITKDKEKALWILAAVNAYTPRRNKAQEAAE